MHYKTCTIALFALAQGACSNTADIPLTTLMQSIHCPVSEEGLTLYRTPAALQQAAQADAGAPRRTLNPAPASDANALPAIASGTWTVAIHLGQKPTAGYGLKLASSAGTVADGVLTIELEQQRPEPGTMQATVLTTPCVLIGIAEKEVEDAEIKTIEANAGDKRWHLSL